MPEPVSPPRLDVDLAQPTPLGEAAIDAANRVLRDGRLFRYGEAASGLPEAALLEQDFAAMLGARYCAAVNSGGCALFLALRALGVEPGAPVLLNAFTLAPVPGAIAHAGARAVLVDLTERLTICPEDLDRKAAESGARVLLLSHMRGHVADMDAVMEVCARRGLTLVEDCAHTTLARWDGRLVGRFGAVGCFSAQSYKHVNGGEGGLIITDDEDVAARAILLSGSYMLYAQHAARPGMAVFDRWRGTTPNLSMRMNGLIAALLRPQLADLPARNARWRAIHDRIAARLKGSNAIHVPERPPQEDHTPTSIQFLYEGGALPGFLERAAEGGVAVKWFGADQPVGFTSRYAHWGYLDGPHEVPNADRLLAKTCDVRLPATLTDAEADTLADVLLDAAARAEA